MTAPGESARDDEGNQAPAGGGAPDKPSGEAAWEPPAAEYPAPAYPPPSYPPGYSAEYQAGYAAQYPPSVPPAPGYDQPAGYGMAPYQPGPPQFGGPPAGYGAPSYPAGYYPTPDYPGGYGPHGAMQAGTNGLAIASLIASFTGVLCCIGSIVAIVLGAIALDQIKRTRQEGYGLAVAGIVIGITTLVVALIVTIFALHSR